MKYTVDRNYTKAHRNPVSKYCLVSTLLLLVAAPVVPAHAYLDPGTGSIILQGLVASIAAVWAVGNGYLQRVKYFFMSKPNQSEAVTVDSDPEEKHEEK